MKRSKTFMNRIKIDKNDFNNDFKNSEFDNEEMKKKIIEGVELNKLLATIYSLYQFCINQYFEAIYNVIKNCKNILVNYETFGNFDLIKEYLTFIRTNLLKRVVFLNNPLMTNIYKNVIEDPTIIENKFNFNDNEEGLNSQGMGNEELYLIRYLFFFCKTYNKINFLLRKLRFFHEIQKLSLSEESVDYENIFEKITTELNDNRPKYNCIISTIKY